MALDYRKIADSIDYYTANGFEYIEVPWTVPTSTMLITATFDETEDNTLAYLNEHVVASAEQSFLHLIETNKLPYGKYCATTPCFRNDEVDELHHPYFVKTELIQYTRNCSMSDMMEMVAIAKGFFDKYLKDVKIIDVGDPKSIVSVDLVYNGIELGSYGIRTHSGYCWVYGTGCAEPRLSYCLGS